jgi:hypothetical protein
MEKEVDAPKATSDAVRPDKALVLSGLHQYLGGRIDSVGRRAAFTMALLGSFLGFISSPLVRNETSLSAKVAFLLAHPSFLVGIAAMITLLMAEIARIKRSDDLLTRIAFSSDDLDDLCLVYRDSSSEVLFGELIKNVRIVGGFLRKKVILYNAGSFLFVLAVILYVLGF